MVLKRIKNNLQNPSPQQRDHICFVVMPLLIVTMHKTFCLHGIIFAQVKVKGIDKCDFKSTEADVFITNIHGPIQTCVFITNICGPSFVDNRVSVITSLARKQILCQSRKREARFCMQCYKIHINKKTVYAIQYHCFSKDRQVIDYI